MSRKRHTAADEPHFLVRTLAAEFHDGQSLHTHAHAWGQLVYVATGLASVWTEHGSWVAPPTLAIWAPAGIAHALEFTGRAKLHTLYLRPGLGTQSPRSAAITVSPLLRELVARAVTIGMLDDREPAHVALATLVIDELRVLPVAPFDLPQPTSERLRRVAEHLRANDDDHAALARTFGLGRRTLERGFERETGLSLGRWRQKARLLRALRRLGAGAPVKAAAIDAGYASASAFVAAFRASFGTTPGRYFA